MLPKKKTCNRCKIEKELTEFVRSKKIKSGFTALCKLCNNLSVRLYKENFPEKLKEKHRGYYHRDKNTEKGKLKQLKKTLYKFKISLKEYNDLFLKQNNLCAICNLPEKVMSLKGKLRKLAVDHCHKTGKIRGLLCSNCNTGIGKLKDNPELLLKAASYIAIGGVSYEETK